MLAVLSLFGFSLVRVTEVRVRVTAADHPAAHHFLR